MKIIKKLIHYLLFPPCYLLSQIEMRLFPVNVLEPLETIELLSMGYSFSRFGDGEFNILLGRRGPVFQSYDYALANRLKHILYTQQKEKYLIGLPRQIATYNNTKLSVIRFWSVYNTRSRNRTCIRKLLKQESYADTHFARVHILKRDFNRIDYSIIWDNKDVVIVEGETVKFGINTTLLSSARSVKRIIVPSINAFSRYSEILEKIQDFDKSCLVLIILGPTATVLAYDLYIAGYQAIDFGQGQNNSNFIKENESVLSEEEYLSQIITCID